MASPHRVIAVAAAAALALLAIATAWPAAVHGNTPGNTPGDTPSGDGTITIERAVSSSSPASPDTDTEADTASRRISCGGTAPFTERCTRTMVVRSGGSMAGMDVETGFNGTVKWRLASDTAIAKYECSWQLAGILDTGDCTKLDQSGNFQAGDQVQLRGVTILPGTHLLDDESYGIWEVSFTNK